MKSDKYFFDNDKFVIEDYDKTKTFASFLPGIAGINGMPIWSFYVNRGQGMGSFGVGDKNSTIMEFYPANLMYRNIEMQGFRTFIKYNNEIHEIFSSTSKDDYSRRMIIEKNILSIQEINKTLNIKVTVTYFIVPNETLGALARHVEIENLNEVPKSFEILDGMPQIIPYGVKNSEFKEMSNLLKAWFDVFNTENNIPYYKVRSTTSDSTEISEIEKGNFYLSFTSDSKELVKPIVDMDLIFGYNTSFSWPNGWNCSISEMVNKKQVAQNKVSGGFTAAAFDLHKDAFSIYTLIGNIAKPEIINSRKNDFTAQYFVDKESQARDVVDKIVGDTFTKTSNIVFDNYISQCYLDNIMRGGYPLMFNTNNGEAVYYVYSRKHGDMEREYNFFSTEPTFYSQGNGNFRDVNQNRRNDIYFRPEIGDANVKQFMNLIQIDGYNPLGVKGTTFKVCPDFYDEVLNYVSEGKEKLSEIISKSFTPGKLISYIMDNDIKLNVGINEFLSKIIEKSEQEYEAEFGEGYWSDHWTYNMDLIDSYLSVFPDKYEELMFDDNGYVFFDSPVMVLPRRDKYVLTGEGKVRQYGSIIEDKEKCNALKLKMNGTNWLKDNNGKGDIYKTNLFVKLVSLSLNKFVNLDPEGMGIEMEAEKPGWNDAMNGLPGLFGSGLSETAELKRIVDFLINTSAKYEKEISLPVETYDMLEEVEKLVNNNLSGNLSDFDYWDKASKLKEEFRLRVRFGIEGKEVKTTVNNIIDIFKKFKAKLDNGLQKALELGGGVYPTYLRFEPVEYEVIPDKLSPVKGYQNVTVKKFICKRLPLFLEGPARMMKCLNSKDAAKNLYSAIKGSGIYDEKLKMYKVSEPLSGESNEIGRVTAFTPGWLERESIFLHMEYKYLLSILKSGLYEEFYEDSKSALLPFLDPEVYGRSTIENSSFIVSSANPDETLHGRGFVARLSGSTAEMLSMWVNIMAGSKIFSYENEELSLTLNPKLPGWLFDDEGKISFKLLGKTIVNYHNPKKANTYGENCAEIKKITLNLNGEVITLEGNKVTGEYACAARKGLVSEINAYFS